MAKTSLTMGIRISGARETLKAFNDLPKDANNELRDRSKKLSEMLADKVRQAARSDQSPQSALLAPTVKARRDRVPVIVAGGARRIGSRGRPAWALLFGAEFGSNRHRQFRKQHTGKDGSWLFPVADEHRDLIDREWNAAADEIAAKWAQGGTVAGDG